MAASERGKDVPHGSAPAGFESLFDGRTLQGWRPIPRVYGTVAPGGPRVTDLFAERGIPLPPDPESHPAIWTVEDGAIVGRQDAPGSGYGGYLITERAYRDFELLISARPDWPADTGVMLRRQRDSWEGIQLLLDHRPKGGIGGFFGNGLASFSAAPFTVDATYDRDGVATALTIHDPGVGAETTIAHRRGQLRYAAPATDFLTAWRWGEWNDLRVRCVGDLPVLTTWINGVLIAELDMATIDWPGYDPEAVRSLVGKGGHIALEVHDNDPANGTERWGVGAACRWRDVAIREF